MTATKPSPVHEIARRKALIAAVRERARTMFEAGTPGIQIAAAICSGIEDVLLSLIEETLESFGDRRDFVAKQGAIVAIGGTGRGELAPYSDIDLLFLHNATNAADFDEFVPRFVQMCWDSGIQLGHAVRDVNTCIALSRRDPQIATALIESRHLWGNEKLTQTLIHQFRSRVVNRRKRKFIEDCLRARSEGWSAEGPLAQELEPDVKASAGGLRDLHLIRWVAYARYGIKDIDSLRLQGVLSKSDATRLKDAWEFLTRLRIDLHLSTNREQDRLTRDEQLRITRERGFTETAEQRPVERFMQEYFHHSSELATIAQRFASLQRRRSLAQKARDMLMGHRAEGYLYVTPDQITVADRHLPRICASLESMLHVYRSSALYDLPLSPQVREAIKQAVPKLEPVVSKESARLFMDILRCVRSLGPTLRSMFNTGLIDLVIPDVAHIRNLLQFNQYHHFTVDEHTLRAIETVTGYETDDTPIGAAYRAIRHKELLHLAVFLHDLGKGFETDHCIVGEEIALRIGTRLMLPEYQVEQLALLVRRHLEMADVAWRRDITDPALVLNFSRDIGSPDTLRMLYVLTAADVTSVGPGTWTHWKAGLLAELFDRCLVILSGKRYSFHEAERIRTVKQDVLSILSHTAPREHLPQWIDSQLGGFSSYYLTTTSPKQIAADLQIIEKLSPTAIEVVPSWSAETGTSEYRIITRNPLATTGCFYKMCGVLTAKRLAILSADINTTADGVVVDSYLVIDTDYGSEPPPSRFEEIAETFRDVLQGKVTVESLFIRNRRFGSERMQTVSDLPTRVQIDNESSDTRTIIDCFAHDRPGLLFTIARALFELNLSTDLAKISTHFDQVVDIFYVQELDGSKVRTPERIRQLKERLEQTLRHFEQHSHKQFLNGK
ncbi:[protein-PII] uridylyltransferase [Planctomicrobium piriforme]|uniref:Bifunctional uridylyltransferase/uridylyl-removing enzyme n=1 Tax=Planctomicrobium piriforme TaxID=1576369 RepID=A0A1I3F6N0_9PLAN|nr:[protein-PII] uridylyltransferase [Planctomicrobium piriforme]SFI06876.1 [protein-PII] uridylyltransferase [Planctomicrobium piriforme]